LSTGDRFDLATRRPIDVPARAEAKGEPDNG
jgi:hypothetical protein